MISYRTWEFKKLFSTLPREIQQIAHRKFARFVENPNDPSLHRHALIRHSPCEEVRITRSYRAIFRRGNPPDDEDVYIWVWIGSHSDFDKKFP